MNKEMTHVVRRIADYLNANGIGPRAAALDIGCAPSAISEILNGKTRDPRSSLVAAICHRYLLSADYILLGRQSLRAHEIEEVQEQKKLPGTNAKQPLLPPPSNQSQQVADESDQPYLVSLPTPPSPVMPQQSQDELIKSLRQQIDFLQHQVISQSSIIENLTTRS